MSHRLAAALALVLATAALPARADDVADAKARFRKGVELYRAERWREAVAEFEAAYRLKPHGAIRFNVAQCRERLEEWPAAHRSYHDYLREVPDASDRAAVRAALRRIEERLASAGVQALLVYSDPPGARVALDERDRGATPFQAVLPPGSYALAVSLDGHEPLRERIDLPPAAARVVDVVLRPTPRVAPPGEPVTAAAAPDLSPRAPAPAPPLAPAPPRPHRSRRQVAAWIAGGTAIAAATAGALFGWSARRDEEAIGALPQPDGATAARRAQGAQSKARTANVLYAAAGGAAAASVTLFVLEARF